MKPLAEIALRYKLGEVLILRPLPDLGPKPIGQVSRHARRRRRQLARLIQWLIAHPEKRPAAAAYDTRGKKLGLVTTLMQAGGAASLVQGAPDPDDAERWEWIEKGRAQVEELLRERPELAHV